MEGCGDGFFVVVVALFCAAFLARTSCGLD